MNEMLCATCDQELTVLRGRSTIPIVGTVCFACSERLHSRTRLEGCVDGPPIVELAGMMADEFDRRRTKLIERAREVCVVAR